MTVLPIASTILPLTVRAETPVLGVVKSQENVQQWQGIIQRLSLSGINYCILDLQQVKTEADLINTKLLLLPNIESFNNTQVTAIQQWMDKGGRVIATGPVGALSTLEVRNQLKLLFGAYWGFPLTTAAKLQAAPLKNTADWMSSTGLFGIVRGGVVIPSGLTNQTVALWKSESNQPAVITTEKSILLGWRWGIDAVAPIELDNAWLRAALNRYGVTPGKISSAVAPTACLSAPSITTQKIPSLAQTNRLNNTPISPQSDTSFDPFPEKPTTTRENQIVKPSAPTKLPEAIKQPVAILPLASTKPIIRIDEPPLILPPNPEIKPGPDSISSAQLTFMRQELENLIGRFESAMLATKLIDSENVASVNSKLKKPLESSPAINHPSPATIIANKARKSLQTFLQLVEKKDYDSARHQWLQARLSLWENYPTEAQLPQPEIRAMWLDRGTIVNAGSEKSLAKIFDNLAAAGINTVFFETVNAGYTIYPSHIAPEQNPLIRNWDPLAVAVKLAHERGMELHAWVWIFAAGNQHHNELINRPINYPGPVISAHPEWANYDLQGRLFDPSGKAFLDPANSEVRNYLWQLLEEIATRYQVDGIQLDYIRYPFQDITTNQIYGYGVAGNQEFHELMGLYPKQISILQPDLWKEWIDFKIRQIDSFVANASHRLHSKRPDLILSAAVFPIPRNERLQIIQQNWEDWITRKQLDLLVPMSYALDTNQLQELTQPILTQKDLSATLIVPGIRLFNLPNIVAVDQIQLLRDLSAGGYSLFATQDLNNNLQTIFNRTQSLPAKEQIKIIPYRQPFQASVIRYAALQKEWNYLLINKQFSIQSAALKEWKKQSEDVAKMLNQLAAQPSIKNVLLAKVSIESLRSQFPKWMASHTLENPYQVQVWLNRLATLERLLSYGERTILNRQK